MVGPALGLVVGNNYDHCISLTNIEPAYLGYNYCRGYKGTVATLILSKTGVKIGVPYGASLPDAMHLLAGAGKVHRHVAITEAAQLPHN